MRYGDPQERTMVARLLAAYDMADQTTRDIGDEWYATMRTIVDSLAESADLPSVQVSACMAVLSANTGVADNIRYCEGFVEHYRALGPGAGPPRGFHTIDASERAWQCLTGDLSPIAIVYGRNGPTGSLKTRYFHRNIMGATDVVTIDRHAARMAGSTNDHQPTSARYRRIAAAYVKAADRRGVSPRTLQATVWVVSRGGAAW